MPPYGIAVIADVVYNHAGGDICYLGQSIYYYDLRPLGDATTGTFLHYCRYGRRTCILYRPEVNQFLIDNGNFCFPNVISTACGMMRSRKLTGMGVDFAQDLTNTIRTVKPEAIQIAEYWWDIRLPLERNSRTAAWNGI